MKPVNQMPDHEPTSLKSLYNAEFLENHGDYAGACRIIQEALTNDPGNKELAKKHESLLEIICWRC